jgi:hypothetical protein
MLIGIAETEDITLEKTGPGTALKTLTTELYKKYQTGVVILVDEYDDPVSSNLDEPELASDNTKILRSFYASIKTLAQEGKLHFVLVTGGTRYSMTGVSSGMNNLRDISFNSQYASICGFTLDELDQYFPASIRRYSKQ